jgi:molecular chaperone DnaK
MSAPRTRRPGKENKIKIQASSGLTEAEIQRMVKDAEAHAEEDRKTLELVNSRQPARGADALGEKSLKDYGDKIERRREGKIEAAIKDARAC